MVADNLHDALKLPSPVEEIVLPVLEQKKIKLFIKRDDLIHPSISGNKWRKLKYNLQFALYNNIDTIITFGGAFSNHLYATAAACNLMNLKSIGLVRGELDEANPTYHFCADMGMKLINISRSAYREKEKSEICKEIISAYPHSMIIPEGGSNELALPGVAEIWDELSGQLTKMPDYLLLATGTGATTAGLLASNIFDTQIIAFSALKSNHLEEEIKRVAQNKNTEKLSVNMDYHFGKYAAWNNELLAFMEWFETSTSIPLDHVYTGKAMFGLLDLVKNDFFPAGSELMFLHTGGLQGKAGLAYMQSLKK